MIAILRLWVVVLFLTVLSWYVLKYIGKRQSFWMLLLFWIVAIFGSMGMMYGLSLWVAGM